MLPQPPTLYKTRSLDSVQICREPCGGGTKLKSGGRQENPTVNHVGEV